MGRKFNQMIEEQVHAWRHMNSPDHQSSVRQVKRASIITVSREFGARGAALAEVLGKQTGFKVWDKELLQAIAKELGSDKKFLETVDERRRKPVEDTVVGVLKNVNTNVNYLRTLIKVVHTIENYGNSIIVGRGANYICEKPDTFNVRIVCPLQTRIREYAKREKIGREEARLIIEQKDAERADFVAYSFNKNVNQASDYDLVLNSGVFTLEQMTDIVLEAYKKKTAPLKSKKKASKTAE